MPRPLSALSLFAFACAFAGGATAQSLPAGPKITISAVTQLSPALPQYSKVDVPMLREQMPAASNGRIDFNLKSYPEMNVQGPEVIRLVRSGQVDIAGAPLTTVSGDVPLLDGFDLPGLHNSMEAVRKTGHAMMGAANRDLEKLGVKIIATSPFPAQVFFCKRPISGVADLKGRKIRVAGPSQGDFLNALGAQPVAIAFGEVYTALERGTVDCAVTGTGTGNAQKWFEVANHLYTLVASWGISGYMVNLAWWNKLDPQVRTFLENYFAKVEDVQWKLGSELTQDGIECNVGNAAGCKIFTLLTDKKMTLLKPTDADNAKARQVLVDVVLPNWVKRCGARCGDIFNETAAPLTGIRYKAN